MSEETDDAFNHTDVIDPGWFRSAPRKWKLNARGGSDVPRTRQNSTRRRQGFPEQRLRNEHTIATSCEILGRGYWTGKEVCVQIHPAAHGTGVKLVRTDLPSQNDQCDNQPASLQHPHCDALVVNRHDAALRTNLVSGQAKFQMVEHLMAAIAALEIDNCIVEINGEEFPALDGSCLAFAEALSHAGLIIQASPKKTLVIRERHRVGSPNGWIEALPPNRHESYFEYNLGYDDDTPIQPQSFSIELTPDRFLREVASARTFVTEAQATQIRESGVASHVSNQDLLVIGQHGPIDNQLRFDNECARHKTLDLIGDLALAGIELKGRFTSYRGGHTLNGAMATVLSDLAHSQSNTNSQSTPHQTASTKMQSFRRTA